jgi:hypothetical protein
VAVVLYFAHYNLRQVQKKLRLRITPAMALGITA